MFERSSGSLKLSAIAVAIFFAMMAFSSADANIQIIPRQNGGGAEIDSFFEQETVLVSPESTIATFSSVTIHGLYRSAFYVNGSYQAPGTNIVSVSSSTVTFAETVASGSYVSVLQIAH